MIYEKIQDDLKNALKAKDAEKAQVLRFIISSVKNFQIEKMKKDELPTDEEMVTILRRQIKQRVDSLEQYEKGGRPELAEKEQGEMDIIKVYMPEEMNESDIRSVVEKKIKEMGVAGPGEMGKVMKEVMVELKGKADGAVVSRIVAQILK